LEEVNITFGTRIVFNKMQAKISLVAEEQKIEGKECETTAEEKYVLFDANYEKHVQNCVPRPTLAKIKKIREPWTEPVCIFYKTYNYNNKSMMNQCLDADLAQFTLKLTGSSEDKFKSQLKKCYPLIFDVNRYLSGRGVDNSLF
jgi:hypothetical protein